MHTDDIGVGVSFRYATNNPADSLRVADERDGALSLRADVAPLQVALATGLAPVSRSLSIARPEMPEHLAKLQMGGAVAAPPPRL